MRILLTGGGSGGHITPLIAVIRELKIQAEREQIINLEFFYLGPRDDFGEELFRGEEIQVIFVRCGKFGYVSWWRDFLEAIKIFCGILQALWSFFFVMPDIVFSKGGYGALPAVIASILFRIPLLVHESDAIPGRVNIFSARFARRLGIAFPSAAPSFPSEKTALVGVPIRKRILGGSKEDAEDNFEIYSKLPVVGIIGASQGSQKINTAVIGVLQELTDKFEVVHQTGVKNYASVKAEAEVILESGVRERYHPFGFLDEARLRDFYAVSDVVVSRASATCIYEIAAWGKPAILIPLGIAARGHQRKNAYEYASTGAALVVEEANLTPHILLAEIKKLVEDSDLRKKMSEAAQRFARVDSGEIIVKEILKLGVH